MTDLTRTTCGKLANPGSADTVVNSVNHSNDTKDPAYLDSFRHQIFFSPSLYQVLQRVVRKTVMNKTGPIFKGSNQLALICSVLRLMAYALSIFVH